MDEMEDFRRRFIEANLWDGEIDLKRNEILKSAGTMDTNVYFVVEGCLRAFVYSGDDEQVIRFGYQHDFIGALDSFISEKPSDLCLQALRKTKVMVLKRETFRGYMLKDEKNMRVWLMFMEQLVCDLLEREIDILTSSPKERYLRVLKRSPQLFQEAPSKHIASYLRMTPETLSRLKKS